MWSIPLSSECSPTSSNLRPESGSTAAAGCSSLGSDKQQLVVAWTSISNDAFQTHARRHQIHSRDSSIEITRTPPRNVAGVLQNSWNFWDKTLEKHPFPTISNNHPCLETEIDRVNTRLGQVWSTLNPASAFLVMVVPNQFEVQGGLETSKLLPGQAALIWRGAIDYT